MILLRLSYAALIGWAGGALLSHGMDTWAVAAFVALAVAHDALQELARQQNPIGALLGAVLRTLDQYGVNHAVTTVANILVALVDRIAEQRGIDAKWPGLSIRLTSESGHDIIVTLKKDKA